MALTGATFTVAFPIDTLELLLALLFVTLTLVGVTTLAGMLDAWRDADSLESTGFAEPTGPTGQSFSLIVPARHEENVLEVTLLQLARQDYPDFEVIVVVGHDDAGTRRVAVRAIGDDERFKVVTMSTRLRTSQRPSTLRCPIVAETLLGSLTLRTSSPPGYSVSLTRPSTKPARMSFRARRSW